MTADMTAGDARLEAYADAVGTYLGIATARYANAASTICTWNPGKSKEDIRFTFSRQTLPMTRDFAEGNPFSASSGNFLDGVETWLFKALMHLPQTNKVGGVKQADATTIDVPPMTLISSDPPYYDNIDYAELSDFFYVWLKKSLEPVMDSVVQ